MPKNKKPTRKTPPPPAPDRTDELVEDMAVLALEVAEQEDADGPGAAAVLAGKRDELQKMIRNALRRKQDEVLYGAIEHARFDDVEAFALLRGQVEEAAATIVLRPEGRPAEEIDAFLVPLFVHSAGGLRPDAVFADADAFELLRASFQQAGLENADATVVLISHLYNVDEIDRISYSELNTMLREVADTMGGKKMTATPALAASIQAGMHARPAGEEAVTELRFLLGFVRRRLDDAAPPAGSDSEAWFTARLERYRQWTLLADSLLRGNISADAGEVSIDFLYQDQFFAARRQAMAEGEMLSLMATITDLLSSNELDPAQAGAVVGPAALDADVALRVALYRNGDAAPLGTAELAFDLADDLQGGVDELCEILHSMGIAAISTVSRFDADGQGSGVKPWQPE